MVGNMVRQIIDVHCHLLPGIDDGAADIQDSLRELHSAEKQGITKIIMTPHLYPDKSISAKQVIDLTAELNTRIKYDGMALEVFTGMECMYFNELPSLLQSGEALTLAGSRYVLIEFLEQMSSYHIEKGLDSITEMGYIPILAHYERYESLRRPGVIQRLKKHGFALQMNYDTILEKTGIFGGNMYHEHLKKGYVDFLGSDCHGSSTRAMAVLPGVKWLEKHLREDMINELVYENPSMILNHE